MKSLSYTFLSPSVTAHDSETEKEFDRKWDSIVGINVFFFFLIPFLFPTPHKKKKKAKRLSEIGMNILFALSLQ